MPNTQSIPGNGHASSEVPEPRIVGFFCTWCTYLAADLAGTSRIKYAPNVRVVRVMCSGRIDPQFVLDAFANGADGVLIGGCHPGDCHYQEGNYNCLRRARLLKRVLQQLGIEEDRFRVEWISAAEGDRVRVVINDMVEKLRALGPLQHETRRLPLVNIAPQEHVAGGGVRMTQEKPKIAFYWCASCGGCEEAVVDLAEEILDVVAAVDIVFWPVALDFKRHDVEQMPDGSILATFLNGAIRTSEQEEMAELLRRKSKLLVAFGSCSHLGGIPGLANLFTRDSILQAVYFDAPTTRESRPCTSRLAAGNNGHGELTLPYFSESGALASIKWSRWITTCPDVRRCRRSSRSAVSTLSERTSSGEGQRSGPGRSALHRMPAQGLEAGEDCAEGIQAAAGHFD